MNPDFLSPPPRRYLYMRGAQHNDNNISSTITVIQQVIQSSWNYFFRRSFLMLSFVHAHHLVFLSSCAITHIILVVLISGVKVPFHYLPYTYLTLTYLNLTLTFHYLTETLTFLLHITFDLFVNYHETLRLHVTCYLSVTLL